MEQQNDEKEQSGTGAMSVSESAVQRLVTPPQPKRGCRFYNWGNNPSYEYPAPREYGARCEKHDAFFLRREHDGPLEPDCAKCGEA